MLCASALAMPQHILKEAKILLLLIKRKLQLFKKHQACMIYLYSEIMMLHLMPHYQLFFPYPFEEATELISEIITALSVVLIHATFFFFFPFLSLRLSSHISSERQNTVGKNILKKIIKKSFYPDFVLLSSRNGFWHLIVTIPVYFMKVWFTLLYMRQT